MKRNDSKTQPISVLRDFLQSEAAGGIVLIVVSGLALLVANSPISGLYFNTLHFHLSGLSILHWINDGLMTIFFLFVGLEVKREFLDGQLASWRDRALPGIAAAGGVIAPSMIYVVLNATNPETIRGWAIPAATDIAFALGVLSLLGKRVPASLKVFLATLAIMDDLVAVVIIALFYTASLSPLALAGASVALLGLTLMNRMRIMQLWPYLCMGAVLWFCVLHSGIHATIAGVVLAIFIPLKPAPTQSDEESSPLHILEHALAPWVAFLVVPIFGFANAGVSFAGMTSAILVEPVTLGVAVGLFLGKQVGVFGAAWAAVRCGLAVLPTYASWQQLYGVALLCGIGFTMSLFIGLLAFTDPQVQDAVKIGVLMGSGLSSVAGFVVLRFCRGSSASYRCPPQ
jgi:NhaA family Na+:H+ antiporter